MKLAVLYGGNSAEREISLKSGTAVAAALNRKGHKVSLIDGDVQRAASIGSTEYNCVFIALHGGAGEDGRVQEIFEMNSVVYTGCDSASSALCFDKRQSARRFEQLGLNCPEQFVCNRSQAEQFDWSCFIPCVLKPPCEGSSIGVFVVKQASEIKETLRKAFSLFDQVIVQRFIDGREFAVSFLDGQILPFVEIEPSHEFFDYHSKYSQGGSRYLVPAPIDSLLEQQISEQAKQAFYGFGCEGFARLDLIYDGQKAWCLEINTIPGFTETSLLPMSAQNAGLCFEDLCEKIVYSKINKQSELYPDDSRIPQEKA